MSSPTEHNEQPTGSDSALVERLGAQKREIMGELGKVIVGQSATIELLLTGLVARGHCLFVGVPGLAKTTLINAVARVLDLSFNRIQFTPDLMPSDITGTDILEEDRAKGERFFRFVRGPVFANLLLADEINRSSPKTQSALLQAMQEYKVTASGKTYELDAPFLVCATQNPLEQEGTYPLPEAQLDRFMLHIDVRYPSESEELRIAQADPIAKLGEIKQVMSKSDLIAAQALIPKVPIADHVAAYAVRLVRSSRPGEHGCLPFCSENLAWGAGPRAAQHLVLAAKAAAVLDGRFSASLDDVKRLALAVLKHRIILNFKGQSAGITADQVVSRLVEQVQA